MNEQPFVSIVMPSYNTPTDLLKEAVYSIINQTYTKFELLIIDDGSNPSVKQQIKDIKDNRIKIIENSGNKGLPYSLNVGIEASKGVYIFRMDADDRCAENRVTRQVEFFESNPDVDIVSTFARTFDAKDIIYKSATSDKKIKAELLYKNPLVHPTVAFRTKSIKHIQPLYQSGVRAEDYECWARLAFQYQLVFAVIPEELLFYRIHEGQITNTKNEALLESEKLIKNSILQWLGISLTSKDKEIYLKFGENPKIKCLEKVKLLVILKKIVSQVPETVNKTYLCQFYLKKYVKCIVKK